MCAWENRIPKDGCKSYIRKKIRRFKSESLRFMQEEVYAGDNNMKRLPSK